MYIWSNNICTYEAIRYVHMKHNRKMYMYIWSTSDAQPTDVYVHMKAQPTQPYEAQPYEAQPYEAQPKMCSTIICTYTYICHIYTWHATIWSTTIWSTPIWSASEDVYVHTKHNHMKHNRCNISTYEAQPKDLIRILDAIKYRWHAVFLVLYRACAWLWWYIMC